MSGCPTNTIKSDLVPCNFDDDCLECSPRKEVVKQLIPMMAEQTWSRYFVSDKYFAVIWQRQNNAYLVSQILFGWWTYRQSNICWSTQSQSNIWSTCRSNIRLVNLQLNIWLTCRSNIWLVNLRSAQTRLTCLLSCSSSQKEG